MKKNNGFGGRSKCDESDGFIGCGQLGTNDVFGDIGQCSERDGSCG